MTAPASPGQPGDKPTPSAPRQPPWWRPWLIPLGLLLSAWLLLPLVFRDAPQLTYTEFLQRVDQGEVDSVAIEANGDAHGRLDDGSSFTTASEKNPTITILAIAWRATDYLAEELKRGNL